jgi:hypothetical protein
MLRLQPSEISISPDDIRLINERLDARARANRHKVRLHQGPQRSRDEALTHTSAGYPRASSAEHSSASSDDGYISRRNIACTRLGLDPPSRLRPSQNDECVTDEQAIERHASYQLPQEQNPGASEFQAHVDGHYDLLLRHPSGQALAASIRSRDASGVSQLMESHTFSAPSISFTAATPYFTQLHSRQHLSEGAIRRQSREHLASDRRAQHETDHFRVSDHQSYEQETSSSPSNETTPRSRQLQPSEGQALVPSSDSTRSCVSPLTRTSPTQRIPLLRTASSSTALLAAAADLPSPLDSITQQLALAHTRLASQARHVQLDGTEPVIQAPVYARMPHNIGYEPRHESPRSVASTQYHGHRHVGRERSSAATMASSSSTRTTIRSNHIRFTDSDYPTSSDDLFMHHSRDQSSMPTQTRSVHRRPLPASSEARASYSDTPMPLPIPERHSSRQQSHRTWHKIMLIFIVGVHTTAGPSHLAVPLPRTRPAGLSPAVAHDQARHASPRVKLYPRYLRSTAVLTSNSILGNNLVVLGATLWRCKEPLLRLVSAQPFRYAMCRH